MNTHVTFVLDSSGSMSSIADDTRGGFNTFLAEQREEEGTATVSLYDFNTTVTPLYRSIPIEEAERLDADNYTPGGKTALHDALATAITETADEIETRPPAEAPDNVVVVALTDGKENASETPQERIRELVETYRSEHGWEFLFIGANQDAVLTAREIGMDGDRALTMDHSEEGTRAAYESASENVRQARQTGTTGGFDEADRRRQEEAGDGE
jgi:Mg-chelatase subunit ChlD